ncbi:MAG: Phage integrase [Mycobacterium sp.]|nr:Phage integrase [Mycobacterium sp.]
MGYGPGVNTMHDGRHYFASSALHNGANIKQLAAWLGHSSVAFTLSVYTHLMPDSDDRGRAVLEAAHQAVVSVSAAGEASRVAPLWPRSG